MKNVTEQGDFFFSTAETRDCARPCRGKFRKTKQRVSEAH